MLYNRQYFRCTIADITKLLYDERFSLDSIISVDKGLHKTGKIPIEQGFCATIASKIIVDCARIAEEPIICRHKPARSRSCLGQFFYLLYNVAVVSLMPV